MASGTCTLCSSLPGMRFQEESNVCIPISGDGIKIEPEECDDGNLIGGDGCSSNMKVEDGFDENGVRIT